jgi:hypothetical protein
LLRVNPNPKIEKLKDFRNSDHPMWYRTPRVVKYFTAIENRKVRKIWKQRRWEYQYNDQLSFSTYNSRHQVLWDLA